MVLTLERGPGVVVVVDGGKGKDDDSEQRRRLADRLSHLPLGHTRCHQCHTVTDPRSHLALLQPPVLELQWPSRPTFMYVQTMTNILSKQQQNIQPLQRYLCQTSNSRRIQLPDADPSCRGFLPRRLSSPFEASRLEGS